MQYAALRCGLQDGEGALAWAELALAAGDDYELCFTAPAGRRPQVEAALVCTCVGVIEARPGLRCVLRDGTPYRPPRAGWDHFDG